MKYRRFGKTSLMVSEIGMGCWEISGVSRGGGLGYGPQDDRYSIEMIRRALQLGINFFDTADAYGLGHSEVILGRALKDISGKRPFVVTKGGNDFYVQPWRKNFEAYYIGNAVENSLQRLGIECIDLYLLHGPSLEIIKAGDIFQTLDKLTEEGKIKYYGISIQDPQEGAEAMAVAPNLSAIMCPYNILEQEAARLFKQARERGVAIIARSPLASGRLSGAFKEDTVFPEGDYRAKFDRDWLRDTQKKTKLLSFLVKGQTKSLAQAALKYILANEDVTVAVPGPKKLEELEENVRTCEGTPLSEEDLKRIAELHEQGLLKSDPV